MPSNEDPKNRAAGGKKNVNPNVVGFGPPCTETDGTPAAAPGNEGNAPVPPNSVSSSADGTPMEVDPNASVKDKVSHWAKEVEKLCYSYGDQLMQVTQEKLDSVRLGNPQLFKDTISSWGPVRKKVQPALNQYLVKLVEAVPDDVEPEPVREVIHPRVRAVAFRDLVENARTDIVGSLDELLQWVVANAQDPAAIQALVGHKQAAYTQIYDTVLGKMSRDICERMAESGSAHIDFGRDSDYGQAMEAQQALAKDRDDLQLQLEGFQQQVADLKASEAYLQRQCTEMQEKFSGAQTDLLAYTDKVGILEAVTTFLGTTENDVVGVLAHIQLKYRNLEQQVAEYKKHVCSSDSSVFQDGSARIADLESQHQSAKTANVHLQRTVAEYEKQLASSFGGSKQSLVERAREIGFFVDASGNLQLGPSPSKVFDVSKPYCYSRRTQSVPAPPPLKVFLGDYKEDKMGLSEFLRMYKHRYGPCSEDTKVDILGECLAGEAKRVYRSILSSWDSKASITYDELEFRMKNLMLDNSRTGMLLKQQRVHSLRMKEDESYLSFITFLETKVCEAYDDASLEISDGVKIQVLLRNLRDPTLALQVEQALRTVPMGSPLFPTAKDLVIAYDRTSKQALQWSGKTDSNPIHNSGAQPASAYGSVPAQGNGSVGFGAKSHYRCYSCREMGHRSFECPQKGSSSSGANASGPAKFGNFSPPTCHNCGEKGHIRPNCPSKGNANVAVSSRPEAERSAPIESKHADASLRVSTVDAFLNMCAERDTEAELIRGVVGVQCVAPILVNGVTVKALFDLDSQVNIISKACLRDVLQKGNVCGSTLPAVLGNPTGVNLKDASGSPMAFMGVGHCMLQTSTSDTAEEHKFLVQENPTTTLFLAHRF